MTLKRIFGSRLCWIFVAMFPVLTYMLLSVQAGGSQNAESGQITGMSFGVVDNDNTAVSRTLISQLSLRYNITEVDEADIAATLTESNGVAWILAIGEGYGIDVLNRNTELESLTSYTLTMTDVAAIGTLAAQNITRALMILPLDNINDTAALEAWEQSSLLQITAVEVRLNWEGMAQWLSMFGFVSILTAYFVVRTLSEDKLSGMPDRIGALPVTTRSFLSQGMLAAFAATEVSVALTIVALRLTVGEIENALLLFTVMSLYNLFAVSLVLTLTSIVKSLAGVSVAVSMIATLSSMLGGLFWPLELVPDFMQKIAWFTPGYWFGQGLRTVGEIDSARELTLHNFGLPVLFLSAFCVVTLLLGGLRRVQKLEVE
jgi:ABC-2 type transport system permease protein